MHSEYYKHYGLKWKTEACILLIISAKTINFQKSGKEFTAK